MSLMRLLSLCLLLNTETLQGQVTRISERNRLLHRHKRYLTFPTGSSFLLTFSFVKSVMQVQPRGYNVIGECDVPFPLPNDTRVFENKLKNRRRQRREIYSLLEDAMTRTGLNGNACLNRLICDAQDFAISERERKSLVRDLLSAIFTIPEDEDAKESFCGRNSLEECGISLFEYIAKSLTTAT